MIRAFCACLIVGNTLAPALLSAAEQVSPKSTNALKITPKYGSEMMLNGVTIDCAILQDDSMAIIASNTNSKNYSCDIKCDLKTLSGATSNFSCSATLPAHAAKAAICSQSGNFSSILGGSYSCK